MLFNSLVFFAFLAVVLALHRALPWRAGRVMLVAASYVFYGFGEPRYCLLLLTSTAVDFVVAGRLARTSRPSARKSWLLVSLGVNLGLLGLFKYGDFTIANLNLLFARLGAEPLPALGWVLPIGISFYTFQTLSYTIDVYYRKIEPSRDFLRLRALRRFLPATRGRADRTSEKPAAAARREAFGECRGLRGRL